MLAPDDEGRALEALRFSLASDIVELVVLTGDDLFLQTLREAVGPARRLWHVPSSDKVSDLLVAGGVGILVLDVPAVHDMGLRFISEIKRQFPDLVVVAAGTREHETALARLISDGTIYRFIHKPMSPARARLFADAAVKKYDEQRKSDRPAVPVAAPRSGGLFVGIVCAALCLALAGIWFLRRGNDSVGSHRMPAALEHAAASPGVSSPGAVSPGAVSPGAVSPGAVSPDASSPDLGATDPGSPGAGGASLGSAGVGGLLARAAQALAANRLSAPAGDNALDLYRQALVLDPGNADARAGVAEVHERLLSRAENALFEERLDEAAADLDAARNASVDAARVAFLAGRLAKARTQLNVAAAAATAAKRVEAPPAEARSAAAQAEEFAALAIERIREEHLLDPGGDSARFYVKAALKADAASQAALDAREQLALALLTAARAAIDRRDFARASNWIEAASGLASPDNVGNLRRALEAARREAESDAERQLLKSAEERLHEDRLIEPENDNAKYYLTTLRGMDPANAGLAQATAELGARLVAKGRSALTLKQYDAARSWLDEAAAIGYAAPEAAAVRGNLETALAEQGFLDNVVNVSRLDLVKSTAPVYPRKAEQSGVEGWVELEFTVAESGGVKDATVRAASPPGVFDQAAVSALLQWHFKPVMREAKPVAQRARVRIRFALPRQ